MIIDQFEIRPRYNEVDQMGYVYHANHVTYCHQARTELLRKYGINDYELEQRGYMLPVISFNIQYKTRARYDEVLTIKTTIKELPKIRFQFHFEIKNQEGKLVSKATSEVVFVSKETRVPMQVPEYIMEILNKEFEESLSLMKN